MKVSVSLSRGDVRFLDEYAREHGLESRSAAFDRAIRLLRTAELGRSYEAAWEEWAAQGASDLWESTVRDGLSP